MFCNDEHDNIGVVCTLKSRICEECQGEYTPTNGRQRWCPACGKGKHDDNCIKITLEKQKAERMERRKEISRLIYQRFEFKAFNAKDVGNILGKENPNGFGKMLKVMVNEGLIIKCGGKLYKINKDNIEMILA